MGRVDHNFGSANRMFVTTYYNKREEDRYNWAQDAPGAPGGVINGFAVTRGFDYRSNFGLTGGYTRVHSPSTVLDVRVSGARFGEYRDPAQTFDPATLQFSSTALQLMRGYEYLPLMTIGSFSTTNANSTIASLGSQRSDWNGGFDRPMTTLSITPTVTKIWGAHSIRTGYDYRAQTWTITNEGFLAGRYAFNGAYTRANNSAGLERPGAVVRAVPARVADGRDDGRGDGEHGGGQPVRDRVARRVPSVVSRPVPSGRLARDPAPDAQPRGQARDQRGHVGVRGPQSRRIRHHQRESDRERGASGVRARIRFRRSPRRISTCAAACSLRTAR